MKNKTIRKNKVFFSPQLFEDKFVKKLIRNHVAIIVVIFFALFNFSVQWLSPIAWTDAIVEDFLY